MNQSTDSTNSGRLPDEYKSQKLERAACASIRGYLTQLSWTALKWLNLSDNEMLLIEGREDIDHLFLNAQGQLQRVTETQIKDISTAVNIRSEAVWESVFNFMLSYHHHKDAGRNVKLEFLTTAPLKQQTTSQKTNNETNRLHLNIDVLLTWCQFENCPDRTQTTKKLATAITEIFKKKLHPYLIARTHNNNDSSTSFATKVFSSIKRLDTEKGWEEFFLSVKWVTNTFSADTIQIELENKITQQNFIPGYSPSEISHFLIYHVILASSSNDPNKRLLTRQTLNSRISQNKESLKEWANENNLVYLAHWYNYTEEVLNRYEKRLNTLEKDVTNFLPNHKKAWEAVKQYSNRARMRIKNTAGGIHLDRTLVEERYREQISPLKPLVIHGESGSGKSALIKKCTEIEDSLGSLTFWLNAVALERPDLSALINDIGAGIPLDEVFQSYPTPPILIIDGIDRIYEPFALDVLSELFALLRINTKNPICSVIITSQTRGWDALSERLNHHNIKSDEWNHQNYEPITHEDIITLAHNKPELYRIVNDINLVSLLPNLKILDLVLTKTSESDTAAKAFPGEPDVALWFWKTYVVIGSKRYNREAFIQRLGEVLGDTHRQSIEQFKCTPEELSTVEGLEADGICCVNENGAISFAHDLYADWARLRQIQLHDEEPINYLSGRLYSPLWQRAIRLYAIRMLDSDDGLKHWQIFRSNLCEMGNDSATDLCLDALIFSAKASTNINTLSHELCEKHTDTLHRLLGRFLAFATSLNSFSSEKKIKDNHFFSQKLLNKQVPIKQFWPAMLSFLHCYRKEVVLISPSRVRQVAQLWLENTHTGEQLRREAGELAITLARFVSCKDIELEYKEEVAVYNTLLLAVSDCEQSVISVLIDIAQRDPECLLEEEHSLFYHFPSDYYDDSYMGAPSSDAPRNRVNKAFAYAVLNGGNLDQLIAARPDIAREIVLACLLSPESSTKRYLKNSDEWSADLEDTHFWITPGFLCGPFLKMLNIHFEEGFEVIERLIMYLSMQWYERRVIDNGTNLEPFFDDNSPGILSITIKDTFRQFVGDGRTYGWSAGLGFPLPHNVATSGLMALEYYLYNLDDVTVRLRISEILERTQTVAILSTLINVGRLRNKLFKDVLSPLLTSYELYFWDIQMVSRGRNHLLIRNPFSSPYSEIMERDFNKLKHRKKYFKDIAITLFLTDDKVKLSYQQHVTFWKEEREQAEINRDKERITNVINWFTIENYKPLKSDKNRLLFSYTTPETQDEEPLSPHHFIIEYSKLAQDSFSYRKLINDKKTLNDSELDSFIENLRETERIWKRDLQQEYKPYSNDSPLMTDTSLLMDTSANALCGGIAVLITLHFDNIIQRPGVLNWCELTLQKIFNNPPPLTSYDNHDIVSDYNWESFSADAIAVLWAKNTHDSKLRKWMAYRVFSYHNIAVSILLQRVISLTGFEHPDLLKLRQLVFVSAFYRYQKKRLKHYPKHEPKIFSPKDIENSKNYLQEWIHNRIDMFISNTQDELITPWYKFRGSDCAIIGIETDIIQYDIELIFDVFIVQTELTEYLPTEERLFRIKFIKETIEHYVAIINFHALKGKILSPESYEHKLLSAAGKTLYAMHPEENPGLIWCELLKIPSNNSSWIQCVIQSFYISMLASKSVTHSATDQILALINTIFDQSKDLNWKIHSEAWQTLFGIDSCVISIWKKHHGVLASQLWPYVQKWLSTQDRLSENLIMFLQWLRFPSTDSFRVDALAVLCNIIKATDEPVAKSTLMRIQNELALILEIIWEKTSYDILKSEINKINFDILLGWLVSGQNNAGLALLRKIGKL